MRSSIYLYYMLIPQIFSKDIVAAQSSRHGGFSDGPFNSLNLGLSVNDDEETVLRNREKFFGSLGIDIKDVSRCHQVHGTDILFSKKQGLYDKYDAQITNIPGLYLVASVADCTPVLIHDEKNNAVAAIHAGWRGTAGGITALTLERMTAEFGTRGIDCKAYIGACISDNSFEVGDEVAKEFGEEHKRINGESGKWHVDLKAANRSQLISKGLKAESIQTSLLCTVEDNDMFFSHRKEKGITGRMMAVIGMRPLA
jgi:YfiH family protein